MKLANFIRNVIRLDRAIAYAVAARIWQFLAGGVSLLIIATHLSEETQGFYYTFASLLAIQTFFDLGLTGVLVYVCSHEWSAADDLDNADNLVARQRLKELLVRSQRWYLMCATLFALIASSVGYYFFSTSNAADVNWQVQWLSAVVLTSFSIVWAPSIAILEGCNRMTTVNLYRFVQALVGSACVWTVILLGGGLWAIPCSAAVRAGFDAWLVEKRFRPFFGLLKSTETPDAPQFSWKTELLPLQWRIAIQSIASYFAMGMYTPIIFKFHGAVAGGQMGMTWNAISTIQLAAFAWIQTRVPEIGKLIAARQLDESRSVFRRVLAISTGIYLLGCVALLSLMFLFSKWVPQIASRLLTVEEAALLCLGLGLSHVAVSLGTYVRTMKIDPFLWIGVFTSCVMGTLVWYLGKQFGTVGVAAAHIGVIGLLSLPAYVFIYRRTGESR